MNIIGEMRPFRWAATLALVLVASSQTNAAYVLYTGTLENASGHINNPGTSQSFSNSTVTFALVANTSQVGFYNDQSQSYYYTQFGTATLTISGIGTFTISTPIIVTDTLDYLLDPTQGVLGFGPGGENYDYLDEVAQPFHTYNLQSSLGPVAATVTFQSSSTIQTSGGQVSLNPSVMAYFSATVVPEPSSLSLLAISSSVIATVATFRRRKDLRRNCKATLLGSRDFHVSSLAGS